MVIKKAVFAACIVALGISQCFARGGGHNMTWDPNLFPGATITTINCTGNTATDSSAFSTWKTNSIAANPTLAVLHVSGNCSVTSDGLPPSGGNDAQITSGITNPTIWAYGSTINRVYLGSLNSGTAYFINGSPSIGSTSVTTTTASDAGNVSAGQYMYVTGLNNQANDCGFPANTQFFDIVLVTSSNAGTGVINFSPALTSNYLSTWPATGCDPAQSGKPQIIPMTAAWNTNLKVYGLTINDTGQVVLTGRIVYMLDGVINTANGIAPTVADTISVISTYLGGASEVDKMINAMTMFRVVSSVKIFLQSASIKNMTVGQSNITWLQGTPMTAYIYGSIIPTLWIGPLGYGAGNSVIVDGLTSTTVVAGAQSIAISALTYDNAGKFSLAKTDPNISVFYHMGVTNHKYALGESKFSPFASPTVAFTINSIDDDGTNINWHTTLSGPLSIPTCGGSPCTKIVSYPAATITQANTPGVNLTQYAAP